MDPVQKEISQLLKQQEDKRLPGSEYLPLSNGSLLRPSCLSPPLLAQIGTMPYDTCKIIRYSHNHQ